MMNILVIALAIILANTVWAIGIMMVTKTKRVQDWIWNWSIKWSERMMENSINADKEP